MTPPRPHPALAPRGLSRIQAAAYVGVGATKFDAMVGDGRMPHPRRIDGRKVWDLRELDSAFDALPRDGAETGEPAGEPNEWLSPRAAL